LWISKGYQKGYHKYANININIIINISISIIRIIRGKIIKKEKVFDKSN